MSYGYINYNALTYDGNGSTRGWIRVGSLAQYYSADYAVRISPLKVKKKVKLDDPKTTLNVRRGPTTDANIVAILKHDETVDVDYETCVSVNNYKWYRVMKDGTTLGWTIADKLK